ncbi:MAG: WecB/TagA/CpsF family glycosyltransferase [Geminicoccaceae bacterium]
MLVHGRRDPEFAAILADADLVLPDGMPLVWMLRAFGLGRSERVAGPDLMLELCAAAAARGVPVGFYGGRQEVLQRCSERLLERVPHLRIVIALAPPFRPLSAKEEGRIRDEILASGARLLFVALGCPKQERWMHRHRSMLPLPMIGVGAAVDFHAGAVRRAPLWMQRVGLEWLYRLAAEPRRLWRRYLVGNLLFFLFLADQLVRSRVPRLAERRP